MCGNSARYWVLGVTLAGGLVSFDRAQQPPGPSSPAGAERAGVKHFVTRHCTRCHNGDDKKAGLALDLLSSADIDAHPRVWEKVVRKLTARQMPPPGRPRPDERSYEAV